MKMKVKNTSSQVRPPAHPIGRRNSLNTPNPAPGAKNNPAARIAGGSIVITAQDLKTVFDPVVNEVLTLVKRQIDNIKGEKKDVSAVLLVGGFGQSRYLRKRLEEEIKPISLLCPPNG